MKQLIINQLDAERIFHRIKNSSHSSNELPVNTSKLVAEINSGKQVAPQKIPPTVVTMHSRVLVRYLETGKTYEMELVYPEEANIKEHKISIFAPMATALLGYQEGDEVEWKLPSGITHLTIEKILYQPESAGNYNF